MILLREVRPLKLSVFDAAIIFAEIQSYLKVGILVNLRFRKTLAFDDFVSNGQHEIMQLLSHFGLNDKPIVILVQAFIFEQLLLHSLKINIIY